MVLLLLLMIVLLAGADVLIGATVVALALAVIVELTPELTPELVLEELPLVWLGNGTTVQAGHELTEPPG